MNSYRNLRALPPEIWREIFRWATSLAQGPSVARRPFFTRHGWPFSEPNLSTTKRIKISLSLVCKAWRELTRPFLFEILSIVNDTVLSSFSLADVENSSRLFTYTRHLSVLHNCVAAAPILRHILERCSNVRSMKYDNRVRDGQSRPLDMFPTPTLSSLRQLYFHNYNYVADLLSLVCAAAPQLEMLSYHGILQPLKLDHIVTMP